MNKDFIPLEDGRFVYYPWGIFGKGRILTANEKKRVSTLRARIFISFLFLLAITPHEWDRIWPILLSICLYCGVIRSSLKETPYTEARPRFNVFTSKSNAELFATIILSIVFSLLGFALLRGAAPRFDIGYMTVSVFLSLQALVASAVYLHRACWAIKLRWFLLICIFFICGLRSWNLGQKTKELESACASALNNTASGAVGAEGLLAFCYRNGISIEKDLVKAFFLNQKAALKGDADSQLFLGWMYYKGEGTPQNPIEAYKWASEAVNNSAKATIDGRTALDLKATLENEGAEARKVPLR